MKIHFIFLFFLFNNFYTFPKGINFRQTFFPLLEFRDFIFHLIQKSHWQENLIFIEVLNKNIIPKDEEIHTPTHVFFGVILNKIEDAQIFQQVLEFKPIKISDVEELKMFSSSNITDSFKNIVKHHPFLIINTNELSQDQHHYIKKYCFSGGFKNNSNENKIIAVDVADDKIENFSTFSSLFSNKNKIIFIHNLENFQSLYGTDIGYFFSLLGPALHITHFSKGEIILTYGDTNECIHKNIQEVGFLLFFDKNYNFSNLQLVKKNLCNLCLRKSKQWSHPNKKKVAMFKKALYLINYKGNLNHFYNEYSNFLWSNYYFHGETNFKNKEIFLTSYEEAISLSKEVFNNPKNKFKYNWDHYQYLINILFNDQEYVHIYQVSDIFNENPHVFDEFYLKPSDKKQESSQNNEQSSL